MSEYLLRGTSRKTGVHASSGTSVLLRMWRSLFASILVIGCGVGAPSPSESSESTGQVKSAVVGTTSFAHGVINLYAAKLYAPARYEDAHIELTSPFAFGLPAELHVSVGNAGNGSALLSLYGGTSGNVSCTYPPRPIFLSGHND